ncbi:MAG: DUF853 family protein [Bacillota bacterium]|nr:DUF853 family protein [Bacillota bacterium]
MLNEQGIWIGQSSERAAVLLPQMANRHGLIAGATGTGKTVTTRLLAEGFSELGIPVFLADVKGDLSGLARAGGQSETVSERARRLGLDPLTPDAYPVTFWDVYQKTGIPLRATVADVGPILLARMLDLNETQAGVLSIAFRIADENGWALLDLADLRTMLAHVAAERGEIQLRYGNVSPSSVGAIQRRLLQLEDQGGELFFGEPMLQLEDLLATDRDGRGRIHILDAVELARQPLLYSTLLLWMLSELYENLPEVGDLTKPRLVLFFDEAHLLFTGTDGDLLERITQVIRLIRSKGVGIFFATQNPRDIPDAVAAQLGNRIQHALRAWTPAEMRAVSAAADSFRANPAFSTQEVITTLETGEALISLLDADGVPTVVERCLVLPPASSLELLDPQERLRLVVADPLYDRYADTIDPESAHEILTARIEEAEAAAAEAEEAAVRQKQEREEARLATIEKREAAREEREARREKEKKYGWLTRMSNSAVSAIGREIGRNLVRGVLGGFKKK